MNPPSNDGSGDQPAKRLPTPAGNFIGSKRASGNAAAPTTPSTTPPGNQQPSGFY
jgi:hypothetical protein